MWKYSLGLILAACISLASCGKKDVSSVGETGSGSEASETYTDVDDETTGATDATTAAIDSAVREMSTVYFDFNEFHLTESAKSTLRNNAELLTTQPNIKVTVEGHCDDRGTEEYNMALGERRARAIRDYLVNLGVTRTRINIISFGEEKPKAFGGSETAWSQNRRGEFVVQY